MRKLLGFLLALVILASCGGKKSFEVKITAGEGYALPEGNPFAAITYKANVDGKDTTFVFKAPFVEGVATVTGTCDDVCTAKLYVLDNEDQELSGKSIENIFLENAKYDVTLTGDKFNPIKVTGGGELQRVNDSIEGIMNNLLEEKGFWALYDRWINEPENKEVLQDSLSKMVDEELNPFSQELHNGYLNTHPTSIYALYQASKESNYISLDSLKQLVTRFETDGKLVKNNYFKSMKEVLEAREKVAPGAQAPDFTLNDPDGNPITLSEFYASNKITMIDFWASWCGPCRGFNPTLTKIYAKYHDKGFGILGVSFDKGKDEWVKAIADDKLVWSHVSDLAYWDCAAGKLYNIKYIPQSYFVDSTGKILLASPSEEEIEKFLEENL